MHEHAQEQAAAEPAARVAPPGAVQAPLVEAVRALQRSAGNQATLRWLQRDLEAEYPSATYEDAIPLGTPDPAKKSALEKKYAVKVTGPWSDEDFKDLEDGLGLLTAAEGKRLSGFDLIRVSTLNGPSGLTTKDGKHDKIQYADEAFDRGSTSGVAKRTPLTINGGTQGRHVVLHEVGHVVLYTNSDTTAEDKWKAGVRSWITKEISPMPNGQATASEEELYCESFACFRTGPANLQKVAPKAYDFFKSGAYLS